MTAEAGNAASPGDDLAALLRQFEEQAGPAAPHFRVSEFPHPAPAEPRNGRLQFAAPPPLAQEPTWHERVEPLLQPLRQSVEEARSEYQAARTKAEEYYQQKARAAEEALRYRDDIERAAASVRNVSTSPIPRQQQHSPLQKIRMSEQQWEDYLREKFSR